MDWFVRTKIVVERVGMRSKRGVERIEFCCAKGLTRERIFVFVLRDWEACRHHPLRTVDALGECAHCQIASDVYWKYAKAERFGKDSCKWADKWRVDKAGAERADAHAVWLECLPK